MVRTMSRQGILIGLLLVLLVLALPVLAQDEARGFNYRVESLTLETSAMVITVPRRGPVILQDQALVFTGTLRCMDGGACLEAGADGMGVQVTMGLTLHPAPIDTDDPALFVLAGVSRGQMVGDEQGREFGGPVVAQATCVDETCTAFDVELLACGVLRPVATERRMGIVLTGQLVLAADDTWRDTPGRYTATWANTVGTGYFTLDAETNPVCDQMRTMVEAQTGREFDLEAEDSAEVLSQAMFSAGEESLSGGAAPNTGPILNAVSVRREGDELVLEVNGYWVNRCAVETLIERTGQVDADTAVVRVFRDLPVASTCQPGIQTFDESLRLDYKLLEAEGVRYLQVNGQIIAILIA